MKRPVLCSFPGLLFYSGCPLVAAAPLFTLHRTISGFVSLRQNPGCSDWSVPVRLSRHRPPYFCICSASVIAHKDKVWRQHFWIHAVCILMLSQYLLSTSACFIIRERKLGPFEFNYSLKWSRMQPDHYNLNTAVTRWTWLCSVFYYCSTALKIFVLFLWEHLTTLWKSTFSLHVDTWYVTSTASSSLFRVFNRLWIIWNSVNWRFHF